ncbi:MAG: hypothetical protein PHV68_06140 [Candidatus Gastranaerophilales bacterium]|nr:hypothetical protein [Candidatus Gastranaerophilales bacterium]
MKATEKIRQTLSWSQLKEANAKYRSLKRWKINVNTIEDYVEYMEEDLPNYFAN